MNIPTSIQSGIRHAVAALAVLGTYLASHNLISAGDVATVNNAGLTLGNALTAIVTALCARLLIYLAGIIFGKGAPPSSVSLLLISCMAVGLASCKITDTSVTDASGITTKTRQVVPDKDFDAALADAVTKAATTAASKAADAYVATHVPKSATAPVVAVP